MSILCTHQSSQAISGKQPALITVLVSTLPQHNGLQTPSRKPTRSQSPLVSIHPSLATLSGTSRKPTQSQSPLVSIHPSLAAHSGTSRKPTVPGGRKRAARIECRAVSSRAPNSPGRLRCPAFRRTAVRRNCPPPLLPPLPKLLFALTFAVW